MYPLGGHNSTHHPGASYDQSAFEFRTTVPAFLGQEMGLKWHKHGTRGPAQRLLCELSPLPNVVALWWADGGGCPERDLFLRKAVCDLGGSFTKLVDFSCFPRSECSKEKDSEDQGGSEFLEGSNPAQRRCSNTQHMLVE